jgi:hypothetical protein
MRQLLVEQQVSTIVSTLEIERATKERIDTLMRVVFPDLLRRPADRLYVLLYRHGTQRKFGCRRTPAPLR